MSRCSTCGRSTNTETTPMLVGAPNSEIVHATFVVASFGRRAGDTAWLTGDGVATLVAAQIVTVG